MKKKAFITGGTGFIGVNLVKLLVDMEWKVTALHRPTSNLSKLQKLPVHLVEGSVTDLQSLEDSIPHNTEVVFHLAGDTNMWSKNNDRQTLINVKGTENMVQAAATTDAHHFIYTSSISAWGKISGIVTEQTPQRGDESWINYEKTKWMGERKALEGLNHGMKVVILNPAMVVGPHDNSNWGRLFFALRDNKLPGITHGNMSVAHVKEVAKAHLSAVENGRSGERYLLGGEDCDFTDFVRLAAQISGISSTPKTVPKSFIKIAGYFHSAKAYLTKKEPDLTPELAHFLVRDMRFSSEKAKRELGYDIPPARKSLEDCYRWLTKQKLL